MKTRSLMLAVLAVCLMQTSALSYMIYDRYVLLRDGEEIVLTTQPVDPRSLFRGHYVRLDYGISRMPRSKWQGGEAEKPAPGRTVFATIEKDDAGRWGVVAVSPDGPVATAGQLGLRGRLRQTWDDTLSIDYGLERFYASKSRARALEQDYRQQSLQVVVAVDRHTGEAAIKALIVDGNRVYEEKIF